MSTENTKLASNQASHMSPDDEFDAAMAEATAAEDAPAFAAADPQADGPANGTGEPPAPANQAAAYAPLAAQSPSGNPDDSNLWANAPAELREAYERSQRDAELRLKSVQGRQSAQDRELDRLRQEHAELQQRLQQTPASAGSGQQPSQQAEGDDPYKQLVEDYPEIAGPLVQDLKALRAQLSELQPVVGTIQQDREIAYYVQQQDLLTSKQPDWLNVLGDERFGGWLQEQPLPVQQSFERNRERIVDGNEAAWLVDQFKTALGIGQQGQPTQQADRRARQLASGRDIRGGSGAPVTNEIPDDFDAAMNAFAAQADAKSRRR